jgi:hypothetical protein
VLVHCYGGHSRTGLILRAYLMRNYSLAVRQATAAAQRLWPHLGLSSRDIDEIWGRIASCAGELFRLIGGKVFTYEVPGNYLRPVGRVRHLSKTNFPQALRRVPFENTGSIRDLQGPSYVFAILMDERVRGNDW